MLLACCCSIPHLLVILAIFKSDVLSYAAHIVTALFPQTAVKFKGVSAVHFSTLQKNFTYFHCPTWDVVMSNGNIYPLHDHLWHTNTSQNISTCSTHSVVYSLQTLVPLLQLEGWLSCYDWIPETFWSFHVMPDTASLKVSYHQKLSWILK